MRPFATYHNAISIEWICACRFLLYKALSMLWNKVSHLIFHVLHYFALCTEMHDVTGNFQDKLAYSMLLFLLLPFICITKGTISLHHTYRTFNQYEIKTSIQTSGWVNFYCSDLMPSWFASVLTECTFKLSATIIVKYWIPLQLKIYNYLAYCALQLHGISPWPNN